MYSAEMTARTLFAAFIIVMTVITVVRKVRNGIRNHSEVQESVALLQRRVGIPKEEYHLPGGIYDRFRQNMADDRILTAMAYDILDYCREQTWNIKVNSTGKLGPHTAGQYMNSEGTGKIRIRIGKDASPNIVFSVLIHECMHHFLTTSGIGFENSHKNEVLTDTAALYLGFSEYMKRGQIGVGYLGYRELLYAEKLIRSKE